MFDIALVFLVFFIIFGFLIVVQLGRLVDAVDTAGTEICQEIYNMKRERDDD